MQILSRIIPTKLTDQESYVSGYQFLLKEKSEFVFQLCYMKWSILLGNGSVLQGVICAQNIVH